MQPHLARAAAVDTRAGIHDSFADDQLVTQATVKRLAGDICDMTVWRWRRAGLLPEPVSIRGRNYWKVRVVRDALSQLMGGVAA